MFGRLGHLIKRFGLTDQSYRFLFEAEPGNEAVSLDCETTGFDPWADEIISVAAIRIVGRRIHASSAFRALVKPDAAIRPASIKVHQLREIDVSGARPMSEVLPELLHFIGSRPLVGYWIDGKFGTSPWGILIGVFVGIGGGLYNLVKESLTAAREAQKDDEQSASKERGNNGD